MLTIDRRETEKHPEIRGLLEPHLPIRVDTLEAGDYAFLDRNREGVGIEEKSIDNLIGALTSTQLERQLHSCMEQYTHTILLVRGIYEPVETLIASYKRSPKADNILFRDYIYPQPSYQQIQALLDRLNEMGVVVHHAPTIEAMCLTIIAIYKQRTLAEEEHKLMKRALRARATPLWSFNPQVINLLSIVPRLPEKVAIALVEKYGNIWNILNTDPEELLKMEGVGKTLLSHLLESVGRGGN